MLERATGSNPIHEPLQVFTDQGFEGRDRVEFLTLLNLQLAFGFKERIVSGFEELFLLFGLFSKG